LVSWKKILFETIIVFIFSTGWAESGIDVCDGLIQDKQFRQQPHIPKPALGEAITDPVFGTTVRRITAVPVSEGEYAIIKPIYTTIQAWNADESYILLWHRDNGGRLYELYDGKTYQHIRSIHDLNQPTDFEHILWDPEDPDVFYYPSGYSNIPNLYRYHVSTSTNEIVRNFTDVCGGPAALSLGSDPMYLSWVNGTKVVGLQCGQNKKFLYDIGKNQVLGTLTTPSTWFAPQPAPSGQLALGYGNVYDASLRVVRSLFLYNPFDHPEHGSIGRTSDGHDVYYAVVFDLPKGGENVDPIFPETKSGCIDEKDNDADGKIDGQDTDCQIGTLMRFDLDSGIEQTIIGKATGWVNKPDENDYYPPSNTHISALAYKNPDWVGVSVVGSFPYNRVPGQEILIANGRTGTVCRVANHHSYAGDGKWGYWSEPHVVISPSGTRLLFGSDWENGDSVDTYVVELPSYQGGGGGNKPPIARISAGPTSGPAPLTVNFDGSSSADPDGSIVSYVWDFGDGGGSTQERPRHTYTVDGTYTARLMVKDNGSPAMTGNAMQSIKVGGSDNNSPNTPMLVYKGIGSGSSSPDFTLTASPSSNTVVRNGAGSYTITAAPSGGFSSPVAFAASGMGAGTTGSFSPTSCTPNCSTKLTLTATSTAQTGNFTITVTGMGGSLTRTVNVTLTVNGGTAQPNLIISPGSISLSKINPMAGDTITFQATVENQGDTTAGGIFNNQFDVSLNSSTFKAPDKTLPPYPVITALGARLSREVVSGSWSNVPAGTHTVRVCADQPSLTVTELNESDNCGYMTFKIN